VKSFPSAAAIADNSEPGPRSGSPGEVFRVFLKLGLTSFGGPIAHLGYFRDELVLRRKWLGEADFADLVALCQFLPGPASSQVGFALGLLRGGSLGALAAWCAFTLPSALLLVAFALAAPGFSGPFGTSLIHGLKIVAVAVVAQAVWGMARTLTPDKTRAGIALAVLMVIVFFGGSFAQLAAIVFGGLAGYLLCQSNATALAGHLAFRVPRTVGTVALILFFALLAGLPLLAALTEVHGFALVASFYRAGALVFGGGHVVLPLLETEVVQPGWISPDGFLAGYGAAQAVPGPLFTFAAYLGAAMTPTPNGFAGAALCLAAIFVPGLLLVVGTVPFWDALRLRSGAQAIMRGTNAAVVGILGAALYQPVWTSAIHDSRDFALALTGFVLLTVWRAPPWIIVLVVTTAAIAISMSSAAYV
jgi:chromate transporter